MTDEQKSVILHSLGVEHSRKKKPKPYRSYYCTSTADPKLEEMVTAGWMQRGGKINEGEDQYYFVTEAGAAAVGYKLPA